MSDVGDIWGSVPITGATGPSCAVCGREAQLTPKSSPGIAWPQDLQHEGFAAGLFFFFSPLGLCSCECLEGEVSRATGRKWEDGGEMRGTIICVVIKYLPDGNP